MVTEETLASAVEEPEKQTKVSVAAKPEEIYNRRMKDDTRNRDKITIDNIKKELDYQTGMISACAVITGSPVRHVLNGEGKIEEAADKIIKAIGL